MLPPYTSLQIELNPSLTSTLDPLSLCLKVASLSLFYHYYSGHCSDELAACISPPMARPCSTRQTSFAHNYCVVGQDRTEFTVSCQASPQQEGETVLKCFEAWGRLLLPCDVRAFRHLSPLQARFTHIKYLLELVPPSSMMALRRSG